MRGVTVKRILLLLLILISIPFVFSQNQQYHLKLLAVQESDNKTLTGSDADLYLEIQKGSGRVFLETFPLTKLDTQISTRFAKDAACHHFKLECDQYDFIYTIKAKSSIIGGPSAGAAIAALTTIAVLDIPYDDKSTTVTGTINSGGIIGPVGGIQQKLEAAAQAKL
ncbi:MAG: S16 family serine protease, partial [Nanoarchaeota archaeon]|nr:S16 family serine protease [Nanoarchaeota archaeon]